MGAIGQGADGQWKGPRGGGMTGGGGNVMPPRRSCRPECAAIAIASIAIASSFQAARKQQGQPIRAAHDVRTRARWHAAPCKKVAPPLLRPAPPACPLSPAPPPPRVRTRSVSPLSMDLRSALCSTSSSATPSAPTPAGSAHTATRQAGRQAGTQVQRRCSAGGGGGGGGALLGSEPAITVESRQRRWGLCLAQDCCPQGGGVTAYHAHPS